QRGTVSMSDARGLVVRRSARHGSGPFVASTKRTPEDVRTAIGLVGEVAARAWLARRYGEVRWRSCYASLIEGDADASASLIYDIEGPCRDTWLLFEVKAITEPLRNVEECELGETEIRRAQECARGDRYRIVIVTAVL